jgi:hypothetical protein
LSDFGGNPLVQPAFRVNGDPIGLFSTSAAAENPEPTTFILVVAGLLLIRSARITRKFL